MTGLLCPGKKTLSSERRISALRAAACTRSLAKPTASTPLTPISAIAASAIASCPLPPSTTIRSGKSASSLPRLKRRVSTSSIMPKSSPPEAGSIVRMR